MTTSEFKYIAFYQILECIFDEVYLNATIQDIKQITNSSWYSSNEDKDIAQLIEIIDKYSKAKNDREKLKLVLDKYFKGDLHKEAYLLVNKEIYKILKDELQLIDKEEKFNDIQLLANALYDFRCECTHSNRLFPIKTKVKKDELSIEKYIALIKKITQRIIVNYNV